MTRKGWKNIIIREDIYNKFYEKYERYASKERKIINAPVTSFTTWINKYMLEVLEEDELLSRYAPALEYIGISESDNTIAIKDHFEDRIVEVEIHDRGIGKRFLYCRYCERDDCLHVGFCFAIREVNKILVERGFKQPRVKSKQEQVQEEERVVREEK
ncbi:hypothetical protein [Candidatus Nitrosocaldus islandicus]|uniref:hypothetical protein n=1 Tax=Candidatus Nitrosocaldus islandicus TaxID=2045011 RepID=UPI000CD21AB1|nr:hypothetical protein [Candidatus Nitrosocaldus islandicus]